eukprot:SAG31_NODE_179_length_21090_cov_11.862871_19_plen_86_part_00
MYVDVQWIGCNWEPIVPAAGRPNSRGIGVTSPLLQSSGHPRPVVRCGANKHIVPAVRGYISRQHEIWVQQRHVARHGKGRTSPMP